MNVFRQTFWWARMDWLAEFDLYSDLYSKEKKMIKVLSAFAFGAILSAGAFAQERFRFPAD